jgi:hypothetical protein
MNEQNTPAPESNKHQKKKYRFDLRFFAHGRTTPLLKDFHVIDIVNRKTYELTPFGYFYFTGTEQQYEELYEKLSANDSRFKIIGVDWEDLPSEREK